MWTKILKLYTEIHTLFRENPDFTLEKLANGDLDSNFDLYYKIADLCHEIEKNGKCIDAIIECYIPPLIIAINEGMEAYIKENRYRMDLENLYIEEVQEEADFGKSAEIIQLVDKIKNALRIRETRMAIANTKTEKE